MADATQKQTVARIQEDVGTLKTDVAVVKTDLRQTKSDVGDIKTSIKAIMDGYVPTALYLKDAEANDRRFETLEKAIEDAQADADAANKTLALSKPGLDLSNGIVKQLVYLFIGGLITVVILYLANHQGSQR